MIYKAGILTTILSQVLESIRKESINKIYVIYAQRVFTKETPKSKQLLPFLRYREWTTRKLSLTKTSLTPIIIPEWKKIIKTIRDEEFIELTVTKLGFLIENTGLTKIIEKYVQKNVMPQKYIVCFNSSTKTAKEQYIKRDLLNIMKPFVDKLNLKYATLELSGIYTLKDWRGERKHNLCNNLNIKINKDILKEIIYSLFNEKITVSGQLTKIRFIKWYEMKDGKVLRFSGFETI